MEFDAYPALLLHNLTAMVLSLLLTIPLRVRWLVSLIAWMGTIWGSFIWKDIGISWQDPWRAYFYEPVLGGGLWRGSVTETEIVGILIFWLLPLALAYAVTLARIIKHPA